MNTLFIGYTRFSVHQYESRSFKATSATGGFTQEQYTEWLYSAERLSTRTAIFINESLPQLAQASERHNLVHIVVISQSLPEEYKTALYEARSRYRFLEIQETTKRAAPDRPDISELLAMLAERGLGNSVFGLYRLDDDDILPVDYFDRMGSYVTEEHLGFRISLPYGIGAIRVQNGYILPWNFYEGKASAGLLSVVRVSPNGKELTGLQVPRGTTIPHNLKGHNKTDRTFPVILDARAPGFFRARHRSQDSTLTTSAGAFFGRLTAHAQSRTPAERGEIAALFPHVSELIFDSAEALSGARYLLEKSAEIHSQPLMHACNIQIPMLMSGSIDALPKSAEIRMRITVKEPANKDAIAFFREAKFTQESDKRFTRALRFSQSQICDVIEPPPATTITDIELFSEAPVTARKLAIAPMNSPGMTS